MYYYHKIRVRQKSQHDRQWYKHHNIMLVTVNLHSLQTLVYGNCSWMLAHLVRCVSLSKLPCCDTVRTLSMPTMEAIIQNINIKINSVQRILEIGFILKTGDEFQCGVRTSHASPSSYRFREHMLQEVWGAHWCGWWCCSGGCCAVPLLRCSSRRRWCNISPTYTLFRASHGAGGHTGEGDVNRLSPPADEVEGEGFTSCCGCGCGCGCCGWSCDKRPAAPLRPPGPPAAPPSTHITCNMPHPLGNLQLVTTGTLHTVAARRCV